VKPCHWILIVLLSLTAVFGAVAAPIDDPATPTDAAYSAALAPRSVARVRSLSPAADLVIQKVSINLPVTGADNSLDVLKNNQRRSRSLQSLLCTLLI
jgi:hypothetical protein